MLKFLEHISFERLEDLWFSRAGAIFAVLAGALAPLFALRYLEIKIWQTPALTLGLALASGSLCIVGWYFATRINMARSDKLALAVAIVSEHASEQKKLNRDFVKALADTLHGATNTSQFEVIGIQPSYS